MLSLHVCLHGCALNDCDGIALHSTIMAALHFQFKPKLAFWIIAMLFELLVRIPVLGHFAALWRPLLLGPVSTHARTTRTRARTARTHVTTRTRTYTYAHARTHSRCIHGRTDGCAHACPELAQNRHKEERWQERSSGEERLCLSVAVRPLYAIRNPIPRRVIDFIIRAYFIDDVIRIFARHTFLARPSLVIFLVEHQGLIRALTRMHVRPRLGLFWRMGRRWHAE